MKVIESRSRSGEPNNPVENYYSHNVKLRSGNNSCSIKHTAMKFACSMGCLAMTDRMMWPPSLSRDRKWPRVTKYTHSRVVGLRLEVPMLFHFVSGQLLWGDCAGNSRPELPSSNLLPLSRLRYIMRFKVHRFTPKVEKKIREMPDPLEDGRQVRTHPPAPSHTLQRFGCRVIQPGLSLYTRCAPPKTSY